MKIKIFIDSNVIIAGLASDQGASSILLKLIESRIFRTYICQLILAESKKISRKNYLNHCPISISRY